LKRLEYRGYDSAGMATVSEGRVFVRKGAGKIEDVDRRLSFSSLPGSVGIAHTRWATHGPPTDENAHPHVDCSGRVAVVHNGVIENYAEIKLWLASRGHVFRSDMDTEVIAHLIEEGLRAGLDPYAAFKQAVSKLRGSYALAVLISDTLDRIYFARMLSPLLVGLGEGVNFVASDIPAIIDYTRRVVVLSDGELGYVTPSEVLVERAGSGPVDVRSRVMVVNWEPEQARRGASPTTCSRRYTSSPAP